MQRKAISLVVAMLLLFAAVACQKTNPQNSAPTAGSAQKPCDRACLEGYVDRYMDAMLAHEVSADLFLKDCTFTENGIKLPLGNEGLWASMVGKGTYKFYVPDVETQQIAFIGTAREESEKIKEGDPVAIALRLKLQNGLISEAEQLVIRADSGMGTARPPAAVSIEKGGAPHAIYREEIPPAERPSREELITVANKYFTGIQKNDGKGDYPFTDDCERLENGMQATNVPVPPGQKRPDPKTSLSYSSAWSCKEQFESGLIHFVSLVRDRRFVAVDRERGIVFAFGFFDHGAGKTRYFKAPDGRDVVSGPVAPWTWQIAELFKIEKGKIRRIEAVLQRCPYGMNSGWSTYEQGMSDQIQIIK
jgi:hypothetical protein